MKSKRFVYILGFIIFFLIEFLIAKYVKDRLIRPYVGDILVMVLLYFFVCSLYPKPHRHLPIFLFAFAVCVEVLQFFDFVHHLGLENNRIARIVLGTTFDWHDIFCYFVGMMLLYGGRSFAEKTKPNR